MPPWRRYWLPRAKNASNLRDFCHILDGLGAHLALISLWSRRQMARITVEDCLDNIDNIFEMVLVAAKPFSILRFNN